MDYVQRAAEEAHHGNRVGAQMATMTNMIDKIRRMKERASLGSSTVLPRSTEPKLTTAEALSVFGHTGFRPDQEEIINEVINGRDGVLVVFPTGYGKSLLYQVPALVVDGMAVVVSPLIALMKDQVDKLQHIGVKALLINSSLTAKEEREAMLQIISGAVKVLYVAPERFDNGEFNTSIYGVRVSLLAVDEAHCISRWGHDFRPSYSRLAKAILNMKPERVVALTATATKRVQDDICASLGIAGAKRFVKGVYRPNLRLAVMSGFGISRTEAMREIVEDFQKAGHNTGIIYSPTRNMAVSICTYLQERGIDSTFYHAGMKPGDRKTVQNKWMDNGGIIVATSAFGMGIDRPDVRFVIHSGLSSSIEDWYQEIGRAGRDGNESLCLTLWDYRQDYGTQMILIDVVSPRGQDVQDFWAWLRSVALRNAKPNDETATVNMIQKDMGMAADCVNVGGCISFLKKKGLVRKLERGKYRVSLTGGSNLDCSGLDKIRQEKIDKVDAVVSFYQSGDCRVASICDYFGDTSFSGKCGACDNCTNGETR